MMSENVPAASAVPLRFLPASLTQLLGGNVENVPLGRHAIAERATNRPPRESSAALRTKPVIGAPPSMGTNDPGQDRVWPAAFLRRPRITRSSRGAVPGFWAHRPRARRAGAPPVSAPAAPGG